MTRVHDGQEPPPGLAYREDLLSTDEEQALLLRIEGLPFAELLTAGYPALRTGVHYGSDAYGDGSDEVASLPSFLEEIRARAAAVAGCRAEDLLQALVARYPPGAGVGWHQDRPRYDVIVGVSLRAPCELRFRRTHRPEVGYRMVLAPRSLYVLAGEARSAWQHRVAPVAELRYSITFRSLRRPRRSKVANVRRPGSTQTAAPPRDGSSSE